MCRKQGTQSQQAFILLLKVTLHCILFDLRFVSQSSARFSFMYVKLMLWNQNVQILKITVSSNWIENAESCNLKTNYCAFIQQIVAESTPGKVPGSHSFIRLFNEHLVNTFFLSLGNSGDKKNNVTALMKLNLNKKSSQSTKKQINI